MKEESGSEISLGAADLQLVLALVRSGTMASAGKRLGVDPSTVFRSLQRLEKSLGTVLFDRSRSGCMPTETAETLARHAERIESEIESARAGVGAGDGPAQGLVRISTTDVLLAGFVIPALGELARSSPLLRFEIVASYQLANLSKRDADIAVRATRKPPEHMIGRSLGVIREAVFGRRAGRGAAKERRLAEAAWIELDDSVPHAPAETWRKRVVPGASVVLTVGSIQAAFDAVVGGLGVAILPVFMTKNRKDLVRLSDDIRECETQLWLLAHPESRRLQRVSTVFRHLADSISVN